MTARHVWIKPQNLAGTQKALADLGMTAFKEAGVTDHHMLANYMGQLDVESHDFTKK